MKTKQEIKNFLKEESEKIGLSNIDENISDYLEDIEKTKNVEIQYYVRGHWTIADVDNERIIIDLEALKTLLEEEKNYD